jgi:hypothetical protein
MEKQRDKADIGRRTRWKHEIGNRIMVVQSMTDGEDGCAGQHIPFLVCLMNMLTTHILNS